MKKKSVPASAGTLFILCARQGERLRRKETQTESKRSEERGGPALEAKLSRLQLHAPPEPENPGSGEKREAVPAKSEGAVSYGTRAQSAPVHNRNA